MKENEMRLMAAPRIALRPDGEVIFYDDKGNEIKLGKGKSAKEFTAAVKGEELKALQTVTLASYVGNPVCKIWVCIDGRWYCFLVDCATGKIIGPCR
jgi:hypothetical protein